jgi:tripartite-type tricarboxylate transporter receptor subunit TctC
LSKLFFAVFFALTTNFAFAQWQPTKPITVVYGIGPGSGNERAFNIVGQQLEKEKIATFVPQYIPGADSVVGTNEFVKMPNDGHYVQVITIDATFVIAELFNKDVMKYTLDDFTPVMGIGTAPMVLIAANNIPVTNMREFVEYFKKDSNKVTIGIGTSGKVPGNQLFDLMGIKNHQAQLLPYKSGQQAALDVAGGHISFALLSTSIPYGLYQQGKVKYIGQSGSTKLSNIKEVDLMRDTWPEYVHEVQWGLMLPKNASPDVVNWYQREFGRVLRLPETASRQSAALMGQDPKLVSQKAWTAEIRRQLAQLPK